MAECQNCFVVTQRRCSACHVCHYCSKECELAADQKCGARVACQLHRAFQREETNFGEVAMQVRMFPTIKATLSSKDEWDQIWAALKCGAWDFLHLLIGVTPGTVYKKSTFGIACSLATDFCIEGGGMRRRFEVGSAVDSSKKMLANLSQIVLAQRGTEKARAALTVGCTTKTCVHFDVIFLTRKRDTWTVHHVLPLWAQTLERSDANFYKMSYRLDGKVPEHCRHSIAMVQEALNQSPPPPPPSSPPPSRPEAATWPARSPAPPPTPAPDPESGPEPGPESNPEPGPESTPESDSEPDPETETTGPPPEWTHQLRSALQVISSGRASGVSNAGVASGSAASACAGADSSAASGGNSGGGGRGRRERILRGRVRCLDSGFVRRREKPSPLAPTQQVVVVAPPALPPRSSESS